MIVISNPPGSLDASASRQRFLAMVPALAARANLNFRKVRPEQREELVQEVLANCLVAFDRLVRLGKVDLVYPSALARYAIAQVRFGRRVANRRNVNDVSSAYAQRRQGFVMERLDQCHEQSGGWRGIVVEDRRATPADLAILRLDFQAWLRQLTAQQQRVAMLLATGEQGTVVANRFGVTPGRISQLRKVLETSWNTFQRQANCEAV